MNDYLKLKELAEAASQQSSGACWAYEPHGDTGEFGVGVLESDQGVTVTGRQSSGEMLVLEPVAPEVSREAYAAFIAAANPAAVLGLIADLDEARNGMKHSCAIRLKKEIERLEAENAQLKKQEIEVRAESERVNDELSACTEGPGTCGYWRDTARAHLAEVDRLKAECEGLRKIATELLSGARCDGLHHTKADLHDYDVPCKVLARIEAALKQGGQSNDD